MSRSGSTWWRKRRVAPASLGVRAVLAAALLAALAACGGGGGGPSTLNVRGTVKGVYGEPIPGVVVVVHGVGTTATDADGRFQVDGVTAPYDVSVLDAAAGWSHTYVGVTTGAPELFPIASLLVPSGVATATVTGELDAPVPMGHQVYVCAHGVDEAVYGCTYVYEGQSSYTIPALWLGGGSADVRLRAIEYSEDPLTGAPTALTGATASGVFTVTEGGVSDVDLIMGVPGAVTTFTLNVTPTFTADDYYGVAMTHIDQFATLGLTSFDSDAPTVAVFTPRFTGATYTVAGAATVATGASSLHWRTGVAAGATVDFEVTAPPVPVAPADGAAGVGPGSVFTLSNPAGGALTALLSPNGDGPMIAVTTVEDSFTLPDLSAHGLVMPAATQYFWSAYGVPSVTDMTAAVTGSGYLGGYERISLSLNAGGPQPAQEGRISLSATREFTTAP